MKHVGYLIIIIFIGAISCKCIFNKSQTINQLIDNNPKFTGFLSEKQLTILENLQVVEVYQIKSYLIEGTENEYSKKSSFIKTLSTNEVRTLLNNIVSDANYYWGDSNNINFNPSKQIILKDAQEQFLILYSENSKEIGIIDLEGQKNLQIQSKLQLFLISL